MQAQDFKLQDKDMELNFGDKEAEEGEDNPGSATPGSDSNRGFAIGSAVTIETGIDVSEKEEEEIKSLP